MSIRGIIWDLDNTLYPYQQVMFDSGEVAMARSVLEAGINLSLEEAQRIAREGMEKHGSHWALFISDYGLDVDKLHGRFLSFMDEKKNIPMTWNLKEAFAELPSDMRHIILTHSSREWSTRVLKHLSLQHIFDDQKLLAFEDVGFIGKNKSPYPFEQALRVLDLSAPEVVVVEDSSANLVHAHELGLTTVFIHHGKPLDTLPPHIHHQHETPVQFLHTLKAAP